MSVVLTQAGETVRCSCGTDVVVPTWRELRDRMADQASRDTSFQTPQTSAGRWDAARRITFVVGCLLVAIGGIVHWRIYPQRTQLDIRQPVAQSLPFDIQTLKLMDAWDAWEHFRSARLDARSTPAYLNNRAKYAELSHLLYAGWSIAILGVIGLAASLVWPTAVRRLT